MMMLLIAVLVVGLSTYVWLTRGFFSALVHLICTVAAGAIAFGAWESASYALLNAAPDRGFLSFVGDNAFALGLALPFAAALAVLRLVVDQLLPANAQCAKAAEYAGGAVCGALSGVIAGGIVVLSLGFLRVGSSFGGYQPLVSNDEARGSFTLDGSPMVPWVDRLTAGFYSTLSQRAFRSPEPLAKWHPDLTLLPAGMRLTYDDKSRTTHKAAAFRVAGVYTVGDAERGQALDALLKDDWNPVPQKVVDVAGQPFGQGYVAGVIVSFTAAAREKTGQVAVGNGQVRLVVADESGRSRAIFPVAVVTTIDDPTQVAYQRFRFESSNQFFGSVGASSETVMAFEFPVPTGFKPIGIYVKGVRAELAEARPTGFPNPEARDAAAASGQLASMGGVGPRLNADGTPVQAQAETNTVDNDPVKFNNGIGFVIAKGREGAMQVEQRQRGWAIVDGEGTYRDDPRAQRVDVKLSISNFAHPPDVAMAQVNFTPMQRTSEFGRAFSMAESLAQPLLVDDQGRTYEAVGFVYREGQSVRIRYTKDRPIRAMRELPAVGTTDPTRKLTLLFLVNVGVNVTEFRLGNQTVPTEGLPKLSQGTR